MRQFFVYILSSRSRTLYIGVTNDIGRRVDEHRRGVGSKFTSKYHVGRLVYVEVTPDVHSAIMREKQIKGWRREKKLALINAFNPAWEDLAAGWGGSPCHPER
jgi:putative endonuclease